MIIVYVKIILAQFQWQTQKGFALPYFNSLSWVRTKITGVYDSNDFNVAIKVKDQRRLIVRQETGQQTCVRFNVLLCY